MSSPVQLPFFVGSHFGPPSKKRRTTGDDSRVSRATRDPLGLLLQSDSKAVSHAAPLPASRRAIEFTNLGPRGDAVSKEIVSPPTSGRLDDTLIEGLLDADQLQYHCDACKKDISDLFRIRCSVCNDFDLCVECFCSGAETDGHRNYHGYVPLGRNNFSLFTSDWNADEELMLVEAVGKFGFGNWGEVADFIAPYSTTPKKKEQCQEHYYNVHIKPRRSEAATALSDSIPPDINAAWPLYHEKMMGPYFPSPPPPIQLPVNPSSSSSNAASGSVAAGTTAAGSTSAGAGGGSAVTMPSCNVVGFMPLRGDFDVEYDNDAELLLGDIELRGDERPLERELKLKVLDIYNAKLDERFLRKHVVVERGFADWRRLMQADKKRPKDEGDLQALFRLLVRFDSSLDYDQLVRLLVYEQRLRERISSIVEWKSLGLKSFRQVEEYERSKMKSFGSTPSFPAVTAGGSSNSMPHSSSTATRSMTLDNVGGGDEIGLQQDEFKLEAAASAYPGASILAKQELEFCDTMQLPPVYFLLIKHTIIRSLATSENASLLVDPRVRVSLDGSRVCPMGSIYDFVLHADLGLPDAMQQQQLLRGIGQSGTAGQSAPQSGLHYLRSGSGDASQAGAIDNTVSASPFGARRLRSRRVVPDDEDGTVE